MILIRFLLIAIVAISLIYGILYGLASLTYSSGERFGQITKFSHKGFLIKTWEGELYTQTGKKGTNQTNAFGTYFEFSVTDEKVIQKIRDVMITGKEAVIYYDERMVQFDWNGDTKYFVTDVKVSE